MKIVSIAMLSLVLTIQSVTGQLNKGNSTGPRVTTENGIVEGIDDSGVQIFKGIPYAQPPIGDLRWQPPQPVKSWSGVLKADQFGPACPQLPIYSDMKFRYPKQSEDCLYLNIWTPANRGDI